jgi:hypothetical protein
MRRVRKTAKAVMTIGKHAAKLWYSQYRSFRIEKRSRRWSAKRATYCTRTYLEILGAVGRVARSGGAW